MGLVASRVQTRAFGMQRVVDIRGVTVLWHPRAVFACLVLGAVIVGCALLLLTQGSMKLSVTEVGQALAHPGADSRDRLVVWGIRLPMIVTGLATGMALGAAGMLFQTLSRNALGSPEIIGLVSGAAFGAVVGITLLQTTGWRTSLAAVAGCALAAGLAYALAPRGSGFINRLVLIGLGLSACYGAATTLLLTRIDPDIAIAGQVWLVGTLNARQWTHAIPAVAAVVVCLPVAWVLVRHLRVMELGDALCAGLGVRIPRVTAAVTVVGVVLTGAAIASTGPISFISLAAPQIARRLTGQQVVPVTTAALTGAVLLLVPQCIVHLAPAGYQAPVGVATSVVGGLYLIFFILRSKR